METRERQKTFRTKGKLEQKPNELIPIPVYKNETRHVTDEWDTEAMAKDIIKHNPLSHIAKYFSTLGYKALFVVPQNSLSQNMDNDAVTTNIFLQYLWAMGRSCQSLTIVTTM